MNYSNRTSLYMLFEEQPRVLCGHSNIFVKRKPTNFAKISQRVIDVYTYSFRHFVYHSQGRLLPGYSNVEHDTKLKLFIQISSDEEE